MSAAAVKERCWIRFRTIGPVQPLVEGRAIDPDGERERYENRGDRHQDACGVGAPGGRVHTHTHGRPQNRSSDDPIHQRSRLLSRSSSVGSTSPTRSAWTWVMRSVANCSASRSTSSL